MIVIFFISKGPSGLKDMIHVFRGLRLPVGIELEGGIRRKDVLKNEVCLLVRQLIGKINRFRKRNIDGILSGK